LVKVLIEENSNKEIIKISLDIFYRLPKSNFFHGIDLAIPCYNGICEALILILKTYGTDRDIVQNVFFLINHIVTLDRNIPIFITAGLLETLVAVYNTPAKDLMRCKRIVGYLVEYDEDIFQQFYELGVPEGSSLFN
jgi:hypothetical protein